MEKNKLEPICLLTVFILPFLLCSSTRAVTQDWAARYDNVGDDDHAYDIAIDSAGNVYVTGATDTNPGGAVQYDYATAKYNSNGTQLWVRTYDSPTNGTDKAYAIALDSASNVYVTGESDSNYVTIKYNSSGTQQWVAEYNGAGDGSDKAHDIAVDAAGNVYVTGEIYQGSPRYYDYGTIKYNGATGAELWVAAYDKAGDYFSDRAYAIAVDTNGVYVTGSTETDDQTSYVDYTTVKYPVNSNIPVWVAIYDGPKVTWDSDIARDIALDNIGNVYVTGESEGTTTGYDYATIKYAPDSNIPLWVARYDCFLSGFGSGSEYATSLAVDDEGSVYVTGGSYDPRGFDFNEPPSLPYEDIATVKYDTNGNQIWVDRYDWFGHHDVGYDIAVDNLGSVYVTGESLDRINGSYTYDYVTLRYDSSNGNELWVARYDGPTHDNDYAYAIAVDAAGNVYVTGMSENDYLTIKYSQELDGPVSKWTQLPDESPTGIDIRCDRSGGVARTLADDFPCTTTGPITDVHLWGSWKGDPCDKGKIQKIHLSIHADIPADACDPCSYSMPGDVLWEMDFSTGDFNEILYRDFSSYKGDEYYEWFWDPNTGDKDPNGDQQIWQYDIYIDPCDAFIQQGDPCDPNIYWLDIYVVVDSCYPEAEFGWKTSKKRWNDDAVYAINDDPCWVDLHYPPGHPFHPIGPNSIDLAFAITTEAEEPNEPVGKPLEPHTKWSQPPVEIDPTAEVPTYCGWDEHSWSLGSPPSSGMWPIVADDFRCLGTMPVTSIHWWGSYADYNGIEPLGEAHEQWRIRFWSNAAADTNVLYSRPKKMLWEIKIPDQRVQINNAGEGRSPKSTLYDDTCFQYHVELEPNEIFWQNDFNDQTMDDIFWMSIEAVDYNTLCSAHWGWKTRPWHWMDDAVTVLVDVNTTAGTVVDPCTNQITPIKYLGESFDVSFELDTDPYYIKWEQFYAGYDVWVDTALLGWWKFDEGSGSIAYDSSGNQRDGTVYGNPTWQTAGSPVGNSGYLEFDGMNDYVDVNYITRDAFLLPMYTVSMWFRIDGNDTDERNLISVTNSELDHGMVLSVNRDVVGTMRYLHRHPFVYVIGPPYESIYTTTTYNDGLWHHAAAVRASDNSRLLYVDGQQVGSEPNAITAFDAPLRVILGSLFSIGYPQGGRWWNGAIDDVRIYNRAMSAKEVTAIYNRSETHYWPHHEDVPSMTTIPKKWEQLPDPCWSGLHCHDWGSGDSYYWTTLADDWHCEGGDVTDLHWWGNYETRGSGIDHFHLSIHEPNVMNPCLPGVEVWGANVPFTSIVETDTGTVVRGSGETIYYYEYDLDTPFAQVEDQNYWFDITAYSVDPCDPAVWRWQENARHFTPILCPAVEGGGPDIDWIPIDWLLSGYSDMAFVITSTDEANEPNGNVVADDWRCLKRTPITAIVWWGSYIGYGYEACTTGPFLPLPIPPDRFELTMWTDVPNPNPNDPNTFSHPGHKIWSYDASEYDEVLVGYDKYPHGEPNEPVFRYSVRLPEDKWFHQPNYSGVFWLSVQAVYNINVPNYDWGWTNHKHVFNDDAVSGHYDDANEVWVWEELKDQTGASEDMSFMLFTDPNECSTCANYNLDATVNFFDYAEFANQWYWSGSAGGYNNGDLDCDGDVDLKDLNIFCQQWLKYCP